ncbi:MAG: hypothetical protein K0S51_84 [Bacillales bacterium]|jgi:uncharacterized protein YtpQ (UPF0354 family)|nr:hypothetical protein [Bacillales bacterium]
MDAQKLLELLNERLEKIGLLGDLEDEESLIKVKISNKNVSIKVSEAIAKYERVNKQAIDEYFYYINELKTLENENKQINLSNIYPVVKSASFPTSSNNGVELIHSEHTSETRVYFVLDLGKSYKFLDVENLTSNNLTVKEVKDLAMLNLEKLAFPVKEDEVAGNKYYFINPKDGYDASRILLKNKLNEFYSVKKGNIVVSIPHQDVMIIGDIVNNTGYDVIAQMATGYFMKGKSPITSLVFEYNGNELTPLFVLANKKPKFN